MTDTAEQSPLTARWEAPSSTVTSEEDAGLAAQFCGVRQQSLDLCRPLTAEDMMVQSCAEASPAKWHLAHTTWFYETFILSLYADGYRPFNPDFVWLFNSYYNAVSEHPEKKLRASFSRPSIDEVLAYRRHVDAAIVSLIAVVESLPESADRDEVRTRVVLGLHHEQQHQELLITDIKHAFWTNPLHPAYGTGALPFAPGPATPLTWHTFAGGVKEIGHSGGGFAFDNESPRHKQYVEPFELASRPVTCGEYLKFMQSGGYERSELWLSEGWDTVQAQGWRAPLYWHRDSASDEWFVFTLQGNVALKDIEDTPVCHVSYFEADAYARWAGKSLPTEAQWEVAAASVNIEGNLLESRVLHPVAASDSQSAKGRELGGPKQLFGDVWEWTASPYVAYPRFEPLPGALGEYNGKFMCNQMVLRGGSVVTPASHLRASYRNFFPPATRWQFSGIRLTNLMGES